MNNVDSKSERDGCSVMITFILISIFVTIPSLFIISVFFAPIGGHYRSPLLGEIIIALSTILVVVVPCILSPTTDSSNCNKQALICLIFSLMTSLAALLMGQVAMVTELSLSIGKGATTFFLARWLSCKFSGVSPKIRIPLGIIVLIATFVISILLLSTIYVDDF